jgi:PAS domain S-box-containing protein
VLVLSGAFFSLWLIATEGGELQRWLGASMKANTALAQLLISAAIVLQTRGLPDARRRIGARILGVAAAAIAAISLLGYVFETATFLDELFVHDFPSAESSLFPGRMSPNAAISIILLASGTLLLEGRGSRAARLRSTLSLSAATISAVALVGYIYGQSSLYQIASYIRITPYTSTTVLLLSLAILLARPETGPGALLVSPYSEGKVVRRLLPFATLLPIVAAWTVMMLRQNERIDRATGFSLLAIMTIVVFCLALGWVAKVLARSDAHLRILSEGLPHFIAYVDPEARYLYLNRAYAEWFGGTVQDFVGKRVPQVIGEERWAVAKPRMERALSGELVRFDIELEQPGEQRTLDMTYLPDRNSHGQVVGVFLLGHDITERKRAERSRDLFLSVASHELKTPVTVMRLQTQLRTRALAQGDTGYFGVDRVRKMNDTDSRQLDRLSRLIEDMLDISRINTGRMEIQREPFDLAELVRETVERFLPQFEEAGVFLTCSMPAPVPGRWDRFRLEQVLSNLLSNALKYGDRQPVEVRVSADGTHAIIEVADAGPGIPLADQERIFRRFERATPEGRVSGLGLGLYISREIAERHGGTLTLRSEPGRGSVFVVRIPTA